MGNSLMTRRADDQVAQVFGVHQKRKFQRRVLCRFYTNSKAATE